MEYMPVPVPVAPTVVATIAALRSKLTYNTITKVCPYLWTDFFRMRNLIPKILLLAAGYYTIALLACNKCVCPPAKNLNLSYTSVSSACIHYDTSSEFSYLLTGAADSVSDINFGLLYNFEYHLTYQPIHPKLSLFPQALACDCVMDTYHLQDSIVDVNIRTVFDINDTLRANEDVTNEFARVVKQYPGPFTLQPVKYLFTSKGYAYNSIDEMILFPIVWRNNIPLKGKQQFETTFTLKSGKQFTTSSPLMKFY